MCVCENYFTGYTEDVDEYWSRLRRLNWKRLVMKEREDEKCDSHKQVMDHTGNLNSSFQKLRGFEFSLGKRWFQSVWSDSKSGVGGGAHYQCCPLREQFDNWRHKLYLLWNLTSLTRMAFVIDNAFEQYSNIKIRTYRKDMMLICV